MKPYTVLIDFSDGTSEKIETMAKHSVAAFYTAAHTASRWPEDKLAKVVGMRWPQPKKIALRGKAAQ